MATMLVLDGLLEIRRERRVVKEEMGEYALLVGRSLRGPIIDVWSERGMERALELIDDVNAEEQAITVRWVWLEEGPSQTSSPAVRRDQGPGIVEAEGSAEHEVDGDLRLFSYVPVDVPGGRRGALELSESLEKRDTRTAARVRRLSALLGGLLVISAVAIFFLGIRLVGRPLAQLAAKAERVGSGDLSGPLDLGGAAELGALAQGLNRMCEDLAAARDCLRAETEQRVEALEQLRHADRLRTVGRLASGIAHELGTPLNVVSGRAVLIQRGALEPDGVLESAQIIHAQADRMAQIIRQLLDFARRRSSEKKILDVERLASSTCELIGPAAKKQQVVLEVSFEEERPHAANGNESEIQQVLSNLLMNAIQSMPRGGVIRVETSRCRVVPPNVSEGDAAPYIRVSVHDQGSGIAEEDLPHVFEPFFTTKDVGSGTGLGLSIVHGIIEDHRGWIEVESEVGKGSRFSFYLPQEQP